MKIEVDQIRAICRKHEVYDSSYFVSDIPARKLATTRIEQNIGESELIIALLDFTLLGSARNSLVVTDQGVAWKQSGYDPKRLSWEELAKSELHQERILGTSVISFNKHLTLKLAGAGRLSDEGDETILRLLEDLQALARSVKERDTADADARQEGSSALEKCEFCGGLIKPDVTFCKYCGIKLRG